MPTYSITTQRNASYHTISVRASEASEGGSYEYIMPTLQRRPHHVAQVAHLMLFRLGNDARSVDQTDAVCRTAYYTARAA